MSTALPAIPQDSHAGDPPRLRIRGVLLVGFLTILALWLVFGYNLGQRLTDLESRSSTIHARVAQSDELLLTVAAEVLLGTVYVRDALIDTGAEATSFYRQELQNSRSEIERVLQEYLLHVDSAVERDHWTHLRNELNAYWDAMLPAISTDILRDTAQMRTVLREQVVPRRRTIIQISEQIRTLNRDAFQRQETAIAVLYGDLRRQVWSMNALAAVLGLAVACGAIRYAGRLESEIWQQRLQEVEHQRELERLSARLVRVQEEERRTIAREVHDEIGQALTAIKIELSIAQRGLEAAGYTAGSLNEVRSITDGALQAARDVSQLLHPTLLDDLGLAGTLTGYLASFAQRTGIRADLTQDRVPRKMSPDVEICAYRIVQEALTNVAKHAQASSCRVYVQRLPHSLLITVEDDGVGINLSETAAAAIHSGLGLVGIRERVSAFGGTFRLEGTPGKGTRLTAELPIPVDVANADADEEGHVSLAPVLEREA